MSHQQPLHVVFGASGGAGNAIVRELVARSLPVRAVNRAGDASVPAGVERVAGDGLDLASMKVACQGASVIYHAVNVPYPQWAEMLPPMMENFIAAADVEHARLVYVDNLYMYGKVDGPMRESTPVKPCSRKGQIRADLAATLMGAHEQGRVQAVIARASDFYGPGVLNAGLGEIALAPALKGKTANAVGNLDMPHTYTYIDDFAKALVTLGTRNEALGQVWLTPNAEALSTRQMLEMIFEEAGHKPKYRSAPGWMLTVMGWFNPMIREVKEMVYEFEMPFLVDHGEYDRVFGDVTPTPQPEAVARTVAWYRDYVQGREQEENAELEQDA
jgi:nucleoside-diphosphate-sugar epimerase